MNSIRQSEVRRFTVHENLIYHVIKSQSQGVASAINELIQNSIDAKATICEIEINPFNFTFQDDGSGFLSKEYIIKYFETFGQPHSDEEEKVFGRFRMGRGQIMALATTIWHSAKFEMNVDIKNRGLNYDLIEGSIVYPGCLLKGDWYDTISERELEYLYANIKHRCRYLNSIKVILNGALISYSPEDLKNNILFEDENCILLSKTSSFANNSLEVYNLGIYTAKMPFSKYRITGDIITKKHLTLNIKRDTILDNCHVWQEIEFSLQKHLDASKKKITIPEIDWPGIVYEFVEGRISLNEFKDYKLFIDINRVHKYSLSDLARLGNVTISFYPERYVTATAEHLMARHGVVLLSSNSLKELTEDSDLDYAITLFEMSLEAACNSLLQAIDNKREKEKIESILGINDKIKDYKTLRDVIIGDQILLSEKDLSGHVKCAYQAFKQTITNARIVDKITRSAVHKQDPQLKDLLLRATERDFFLGLSSEDNGWTDGKSFIALNSALFHRIISHPDYIEKAALVYVHELCHSDEDTFNHTPAFYKLFHDILLHSYNYGNIINSIVNVFIKNYLKILRRKKLEINSSYKDYIRLHFKDKIVKSPSA